MQLTLHRRDGDFSITACAEGLVQAAGQRFNTPLLIAWSRMPTPVTIEPIEQLAFASLEPLLDDDTELLLLGCGQRQVFAPAETMAALQQRGIGCECMITPAACRTYNVLLSEERRVMAILIP